MLVVFGWRGVHEALLLLCDLIVYWWRWLGGCVELFMLWVLDYGFHLNRPPSCQVGGGMGWLFVVWPRDLCLQTDRSLEGLSRYLVSCGVFWSRGNGVVMVTVLG